jgi:hypothetical protein
MYTEWWERMKPATLGERFELKAKKAPTKEGVKDLNLVNKVLQENNIKPEKPRFQYDPISEELQDVNAPGWAEKATKEDIKKSSVAKQTKSPELSGVDRYILAKKI